MDMDTRTDDDGDGYEAPRLEDRGSVEDLTLDGPGISLSIIIP
jgi:hypothetical protein